MSNTKRKARKRAGEKFEKAAKVGTPLTERSWFNMLVLRPAQPKTRWSGSMQPRSQKKIEKALAARENLG